MTDLATTVSRYTGSAGTAQQRYTEGINGVTVDPLQLAVNNQAALLAGFNNAVNSGMWARNTLAASASWKQTTVAKASNYATGIQAGANKYQSAMSRWLPIIQQTAQQVKATPAMDINARLARATAFGLALHNAKLQGA